ncbi:hypothetical protein QTQ03_19480 [Micromonospora sp. WMMA1363]|uniref:hypothetical protein n=1 Tax=Micromonospora sp. WMMA1363 TaxID=3053985 RepID=UPI00259CC4DD|nr:hypothetical protein [Micromonospora sp. WMMA1363]MDM4721666.1 hypothetical protein [Micromonospora sp. WMMA1363]
MDHPLRAAPDGVDPSLVGPDLEVVPGAARTEIDFAGELVGSTVGSGVGVTSTCGAVTVADGLAGCGAGPCPSGRMARAVPVAAAIITRAAAEVAMARWIPSWRDVRSARSRRSTGVTSPARSARSNRNRSSFIGHSLP